MSPDNSSMQSHYIHTNNITLHTKLSGPEDGPLVILLHGFPEFWYGWRNQIEALSAAGFRVAAPDQRGYNLSDKPHGVDAYAIETLAADVLGLADSLGAGRFYLAGHDWGAAVAWETALAAPQRVQRLAILNVPHPDVMRRFLLESPAQLLKSWYIFFIQLRGITEWLLRQGNYRNMIRALISSGKKGTFRRTDIEQYQTAWSQPGALTGMLNWYRAIFRQSLKMGAAIRSQPPRRVEPPVLMLWGKQDVALDHAMAQPSIDVCADGHLVFFEEATHWVQHDEAEAVSKALTGFFSAE